MTYELISGDSIWVVNTEDRRFNPVFVIEAEDAKFARELVQNLNGKNGGGEASENGHPVGHEDRGT
jgi:hypothetical protein